MHTKTLIGAFAKQADVDALNADLGDHGYTLEQIYEQQIKEGGAVLAVPVEDDEEAEVRQLFTKHKAAHLKVIA